MVKWTKPRPTRVVVIKLTAGSFPRKALHVGFELLSFHFISEKPEGLPQALRPRETVWPEPCLRLELRVRRRRRLLRGTRAHLLRPALDLRLCLLTGRGLWLPPRQALRHDQGEEEDCLLRLPAVPVKLD